VKTKPFWKGEKFIKGAGMALSGCGIPASINSATVNLV